MRYLTPNKYKAPLWLKIKAGFRASRSAWLVSTLFFFGAGLSIYQDGIDSGKTWAVIGVTAVVLLICIGAFLRGLFRGPVKYTVRGVTLAFMDYDYYVPPEVMEDFIETQVCARFRPHISEDPWGLLEGVSVALTPRDLTFAGKDVFGMTYPWKHYSRVEANRVLDPGVMGWELKLQVMQKLFPGASESLDIKWLRKRGI